MFDDLLLYESDSDYSGSDTEEEDPRIVEMYDMACGAVGWKPPATYRLPTQEAMQRAQDQAKYTSHIKQALQQYEKGETQTHSDEEWARDNESN